MYLVLYRKYRPRVFSDVISQEHITTTLMNEIITGQTAHAYLFTGSRGTGKTTCAKILAKALNCQNPENGNPCLKCPACLTSDNENPDILEIDAASNNGVENVRALREEAAYSPLNSKYRIYIIDEVHMLSSGAFNALLKIIEEPPPHVIFILATTEVHKIPATLLSRCQRFAFRRINIKDSAKRLLEIASKENAVLSENAAFLISRLSDGGMRDALSLLDQCFSVSKDVNEDVVRECAGVAGKEHIFAVADAIARQDSAEAVRIVNTLYERSMDMGRLINELISHYRDLMLLKVTPENPLVQALPDELENLNRQNSLYSLEMIMRCIDILSERLNSINQSKQRLALTEMCMIKLCMPQLDPVSDALSMRVDSLERRIASTSGTAATVDTAVNVNSLNVPKKPDKVKQEVQDILDSLPDIIPKNKPDKSKKKVPENRTVDTDDYPIPPPPPPPPPPVGININEAEDSALHYAAPLQDINSPDWWNKIVSILPVSAAGLAANAKASYDGKSLVTVTASEAAAPVLNDGSVKNAVHKLYGDNINVIIKTSKTRRGKINKIDEFLKKAQDFGVTVKIISK